MNIEREADERHYARTFDCVSSAVEDACNSDYGIEKAAANTREVVGQLVEILHAKGLLASDEVISILNGGHAYGNYREAAKEPA